MFQSDPKLRHLPFFEEIASQEEGTRAWHATSAGLVVLRLVDAWLESGVRASADDEWDVRTVWSAIEAVNEGTPIRSILGRIVDSLREQRPDIHGVISPLMAYGQALEYDAQWRLAADVYQSVLAHLHPIEDGDASVAARLRLGQCYRSLNRLDDATNEFEIASEIATAGGDMVGVLRARIGEAHIAMTRGNLPRAEAILDDTIARATGPDLRDVRSRALHDRSGVATLSGKYELAIRLGYEALGQSQSATHRDRILSDIAAAFYHLGVFTAARDAYLVLSATAREQYTRWSATLNLLEISSLTSAEPLFELYRRQLSDQPLPPYLATAFQLNLGNGYRRLGDPKARAHLESAVALAAQHGMNQYLFEAEEALKFLGTPLPPPRTPVDVSLDVQEVATALRDLRESAGVL